MSNRFTRSPVQVGYRTFHWGNWLFLFCTVAYDQVALHWPTTPQEWVLCGLKFVSLGAGAYLTVTGAERVAKPIP